MERIVLQLTPLRRRGTSRFVRAVRLVVLGTTLSSLVLFLALTIAGPDFGRRFRLRRRRLNVGLAPGFLSRVELLRGIVLLLLKRLQLGLMLLLDLVPFGRHANVGHLLLVELFELARLLHLILFELLLPLAFLILELSSVGARLGNDPRSDLEFRRVAASR